MSASGIAPLETSIIARLRANAVLAALVTGVFDHVPQNQAYPYVVFDEPTETHARTFGEDGHLISFTLLIYTQDGSATRQGGGRAGFKQAHEIVEVIIADLTDPVTPLVVAGHNTTDLDYEAILSTRLDDDITRETQIQMTAWLEH